MPHDAQLLRAHIENMSEQNDRKAATTARLLLDKTSRVQSKWRASSVTLFDKLQFVVCCAQGIRQTSDKVKFCRTLTATLLSLADSGDDLTKLAEPKFFVCFQKRPLGVKDPVVMPPQAAHLTGAATKQFSQQALGAIAIDRFSNRLGRSRDSNPVLSKIILT
jgi:hypothetical protein